MWVMANTKNTNATAPTAPATTVEPETKKREKIDIPDLAIGVTDQTITPTSKTRAPRINPLSAAVAQANNTRDKVFAAKGIVNEKQANKVIRLLVEAGRVIVPACSVKTQYKADEQVVLFQAVDLITRKRKDKPAE